MDLTSRNGAPGKASRHKCDHDGQAAEDDKVQIRFGEPGYKPGSFHLNHNN